MFTFLLKQVKKGTAMAQPFMSFKQAPISSPYFPMSQVVYVK